MTGSTVSGNATHGGGATGGAIDAAFGTVTLTNSTLAGNSTTGSGSQGGAINSAFANINAVNSTIVGNQASGSAGGINVGSATVKLNNSILCKTPTTERRPICCLAAARSPPRIV